MSSGSESDEDFVPGEPEKVSEEESGDDETDKQYEQELEHKAKKRKAAEDSKAKKKRKTKKAAKKPEPKLESEEEEEETKPLDPEEEKKKADDLWAMFLDGTDTKPKPKETVNTTNTQTTKTNTVIEKPQTTEVECQKKDVKEDAKAKEKRIFEFAGETIVVENNVIKEKFKSSEAPAAVSNLSVGPSRGRAGLSSMLGQLNKNNKLSTLEKSKLDWETYKKEHGIEEEVEKHNKGKDGYLDRQDFLERADLRQFEIERDLRTSRRSKR